MCSCVCLFGPLCKSAASVCVQLVTGLVPPSTHIIKIHVMCVCVCMLGSPWHYVEQQCIVPSSLIFLIISSAAIQIPLACSQRGGGTRPCCQPPSYNNRKHSIAFPLSLSLFTANSKYMSSCLELARSGLDCLFWIKASCRLLSFLKVSCT